MKLGFTPFIVLETLLAIAVAALFAWRQSIARNEDDNIHVLHGATSVPNQVAMAQKLEVIDKWGKILTVITVVFGLLLGGAYLYNSFVRPSDVGL